MCEPNERRKKSILILEDEDLIREALARAFRRKGGAYEFEVETAESPAACVEREFDKKEFDVYMVDLEMEPGGRPFFGHKFIAIRAFEVPGSITIVFSCHSQPEQVAQAMRSGATAFLAKGAPGDPQELETVVEKTVALIEEMDNRDKEERELAAVVASKQAEWQSQYAGEVIVLVGEDVVLSARSRLAAIVEYENLREDHDDWPAEPQLVQIPDSNEVPE